MRNLSLKITALVGAILLWFYVIVHRNYEAEVKVPLEIGALPANTSLGIRPPDSVTIRIKANGWHYLFKREYGHLTVPAEQLLIGQVTVPLSPKMYTQPQGVRIVGVVEPENIRLNLEAAISKKLKVLSQLQAQPAKDYILVGSPKMTPNTIQVKGSRSYLSQRDFIQTEPLKVNKLQNDTTFTMNLVNPDNHPIQFSDSTVRVELRIEKLTQRQAKLGVRITPPVQGQLWRLEPEVATLTITGGKKLLDTLKLKNVDIFVPFTEESFKDSAMVQPEIRNINPLVQDWKIQPSQFRVLSRKDTTTLETKP